MSSQTDFIEKIERRSKALSKIGFKSSGLFNGPKQYVHSINLYISLFDSIPSKIVLHHDKADKLIEKFEKLYSDKILERHYMRYGIRQKRKLFSNMVFVMEDEIIIDIELTGEVTILFNKFSEEEALKYEKACYYRPKKEKESHIYLLAHGHFGLDLTPLKIKKPVINFSTNYNPDLTDVHKIITKSLKKKDDSGLILLHGEPGTGKSTYIQHLICSLKKKVIFLPPSLAANIDSPQFTRILIENPNSIFIIEDAEELIKSRETNGPSNISMLLNLTDGILGDALNTHIICTFNTDPKNIDEALLRKGRLIAQYKFGHLSIEQLEKLKIALGVEALEVKEGMTLSDIYHSKNNQFSMEKQSKNQIGYF